MADRLSDLPMELRSKVLSLIPTQTAVRTSVLSMDWENSWRLITSLRLDNEHPIHTIERVELFYNKVMEALGATPLKEFHLHLTNSLHADPRLWIHESICHHISVMDLAVPHLELPDSFFTCRTLTKLKLRLERWIPEFWDQPLWRPELVIDLPNLEYFDTCAHQSVSHNVFRIIQGSPALKSLSFTDCCYIPLVAQQLPKFLNLKRLEFNGSVDHGLVTIFHLLESCPSLEHLSVGKLQESEWNGSESSPICMVETMRMLEFTHHSGVESLESFFAIYVLQKASCLNQVLVTCAADLTPQQVAMVHKELVQHSSDLTEHEVIIRVNGSCDVM